jgi:hypothetical protein
VELIREGYAMLGIGAKKQPEKLVKIKLLQDISGMHTLEDPDTHERRLQSTFYHPRGDVIEWRADEAERMVKKGIARYVEQEEIITNVAPARA